MIASATHAPVNARDGSHAGRGQSKRETKLGTGFTGVSPDCVMHALRSMGYPPESYARSMRSKCGHPHDLRNQSLP
jgi:hypothetical protein